MKLKLKIQDCINNNVVFKAFAINLLIMGLLLLVFEPTDKADDFDMCMVLYGAYNGKYSPFILYSSPILGGFFVTMLKMVPIVPWYWVTYYFLMYVSFSLILFVLMKTTMGRGDTYLYIVILFFFEYSFYIRCTFTKVAGIVFVAGLLYLFYIIENEKKKISAYILGVGLIIIGGLIRAALLKMVMVIFFALFLWLLKSCQGEREKIKYYVMMFASISLLLLLIIQCINVMNKRLFVQSEWSDYKAFNTSRANVMDFEIGKYDDYVNEYQKLGISENDYLFILKYHNVFDTEFVTKELYEKIRSISGVHDDESVVFAIMAEAKSFLLNLHINKSVLIFSLILCCFVTIINYDDSVLRVILITIAGLTCYAYMAYLGRVQEHTNEVVMIGMSTCLLYSNRDIKKKKCGNTSNLVWGVLIIIVATCFSQNYENIGTSDYYGDMTEKPFSSREARYAHNYEKIKLCSDDTDHLYLKETQDRMVDLKCFNVFDVYSKGLYHNILDMSSNVTYPYVRDILGEYDLTNPMREIINNNKVYYAVSDKYKSNVDLLINYIRENYDENAYASLVKEVKGMNIYRINSGIITKPWREEDVIESKEINYDVAKVVIDDTVRLYGYAYIPGEDSFATNIYVEEVKKNTSTVVYGQQYENSNADDKYCGKYSAFTAEFKNDGNSDSFYKVYLECAGKVYSVNVGSLD